jgi:hypothetical protein
MTKGSTAQVMVYPNNLVIGLVFTRTNYAYLPQTRRFFNAFPKQAFTLLTRL